MHVQVSVCDAFIITRVSRLIPVQLRPSSLIFTSHPAARVASSCLDLPRRFCRTERRAGASFPRCSVRVVLLSLPLITPLGYYQHAILYSHQTVEGSPQIMKTCTAAHFVVIANLRGSSIIRAETLCFGHGRRAERSLEVLGEDSDVLSL